MNNEYLKKLVSECLDEHLDFFTFPRDLSNYCENFYPDDTSVANLVTLNSPTVVHWKHLIIIKVIYMIKKTLI